ncbi:hypothetical protein HYPSUDRAFT_199927 [Hypholoma sublateritium FD-334 SS-4]|uniref:Uncharacterized protein n=1 Tax=Hypholoma sublateritium (strain FD-334 SS-4) TaxID=945553 RepID=A0A0D2Q1J5_HYPSF|nr:hypothetical protein HYPSUDRAFT_199927 [Hypholoma sublateritium FD-334 SS-4]
MASSFFFVAKKNGELRPCQDYRYLNEWTGQNSLQKWIFDGDTTTSEYAKEINGKEPSRRNSDYSNQT